jgi:ABC-type transporter Mla subunit MlaD
VAQIAHAFNAFSDKLAVVMVKLRDSSHSVQQAAQEIATGNQDLSGRTEQAASSLRETASAVEQITASVALSTDSAAQPTIRRIPPLRRRHAAAKWYRRPFQPCRQSKWRRPKLVILPA